MIIFGFSTRNGVSYRVYNISYDNISSLVSVVNIAMDDMGAILQLLSDYAYPWNTKDMKQSVRQSSLLAILFPTTPNVMQELIVDK